MQLFYCPNIDSGSLFLSTEESKHCTKVLRKKEGDIIHLIDGNGTFYDAKILIASQKKVLFKPIRKWIETPRPYSLHIAIAPTKNNNRFEWFLEKATEIGIDKITPIICSHSERKVINNERMEKIILSATKQSTRSKIPVLNQALDFNDFVKKDQNSDCFIAHCGQVPKKNLQTLVSVNSTILIGPEGDFSQQEIDLALKNNFKPISLGNSRLRTETAGIVACHTIALYHEKV